MAREERVGAMEDREAARGRLPGPKEMSVEQTARSTDLLMRLGHPREVGG